MSAGHVFVATLSTEPQGVTRVLDWLLAQGVPIGEAAIVHTTGDVIRPAVERLDAEFAGGAYPGVRYRRVPITDKDDPVADILSEADAWALLRTLYRTIRAARRFGGVVHLSITSGRKTMAVYGMVAAQLLFGERDRVWHLVSSEPWGGGETRLHARPGERLQVVSVPVVRWSDEAAARALLEGVEDPWEAIQRQQALTSRESARRRREFLERYLTPKERELAILLVREGLDNAGLARRLGKREQTVANQLTVIYRKFDEWRGFPAGGVTISRAALIAEFAPYLAGEGREEAR